MDDEKVKEVLQWLHDNDYVSQYMKAEVHEATEKAIKTLNAWDKLYLYLNDWRLGIAPDETTDSDEVHDREIIYKTLGEVMQAMEEMQK